MPLTNEYSGVHGITFFMFPLIKEFKAHEHQVFFLGKVVEDKTSNVFCDVLKETTDFKPYKLDVLNDIEVVGEEIISQLDVLLLYNRPPGVADEFDYQNQVIKVALDHKKLVLMWDGDLWAQHIPENLKKQIILLRPYTSNIFDSQFLRAFEFHYFTHTMYKSLPILDRCIDYVYIGNMYNRWDELYTQFSELRGNIVIAGNFLKNSEKWNKSLLLNNALFIRELPHSYSLPLLSMSRQTFYIIPEEYKKVGMITSRVYETVMAGCKIDVNTANLNTVRDAYLLFMRITRMANGI